MDRCGYGSFSNASSSPSGAGAGGAGSSGSSSGGRLRRSDVRRGESLNFFIFFRDDETERKQKLTSPLLSLLSLSTGRLLAALRALDAEDDVNRVTAYFSYEHFYVIYCKFWVRV